MWYVELAAVRDSAAVPTVVADTLGVRARARSRRVAEALAARRSLLVVDNLRACVGCRTRAQGAPAGSLSAADRGDRPRAARHPRRVRPAAGTAGAAGGAAVSGTQRRPRPSDGPTRCLRVVADPGAPEPVVRTNTDGIRRSQRGIRGGAPRRRAAPLACGRRGPRWPHAGGSGSARHDTDTTDRRAARDAGGAGLAVPASAATWRTIGTTTAQGLAKEYESSYSSMWVGARDVADVQIGFKVYGSSRRVEYDYSVCATTTESRRASRVPAYEVGRPRWMALGHRVVARFQGVGADVDVSTNLDNYRYGTVKTRVRVR